jgi:hypothetical protein
VREYAAGARDVGGNVLLSIPGAHPRVDDAGRLWTSDGEFLSIRRFGEPDSVLRLRFVGNPAGFVASAPDGWVALVGDGLRRFAYCRIEDRLLPLDDCEGALEDSELLADVLATAG